MADTVGYGDWVVSKWLQDDGRPESIGLPWNFMQTTDWTTQAGKKQIFDALQASGQLGQYDKEFANLQNMNGTATRTGNGFNDTLTATRPKDDLMDTLGPWGMVAGFGAGALAAGAGSSLGAIPGATNAAEEASMLGGYGAQQGAANFPLTGDFNPTYTASSAVEPGSLKVTVVDPETGNVVGTPSTSTFGGGSSGGSGSSWITSANALPILGGAASIGSALIGAGAAKNAANTISNAANTATAQQQQTQAQINAQNAPYLQTGTAALNDIGAGAGLKGYTPSPNSGITPGQFTHSFDANDLKTSLAPNYDFMLQQGLGAIQNQNNRTGGLVSGNTLKAINDYAQNYAGNAYQNAFQNYNTNQTNIFNRLSSIAGLGQTANQTTASVAPAISGNIANSTVGAAQAQASGTVGAANAVSGAANNALGWYALNNLSNPQPTTYTG